MRFFSLSPPLYKDEKIEDSITVRDSSSYEMRGVLSPGQDKYIQFEIQDDGVYDWPQFLRY